MKNAKIVFHMEKWPSHFHKGIPQTGFEPAVSSLGGRRFIQLSYWGILCIIVDFFGIQRTWKQMCGMLFTTKWPTALQLGRWWSCCIKICWENRDSRFCFWIEQSLLHPRYQVDRILRRWTQCIYSLSTEIKKMQLYQGISPHSL